jgi:hypothetical protein
MPVAWLRALANSSLRIVFSAFGNAILRYEPRYDRRRCAGCWPRTGHAPMRNFETVSLHEKLREWRGGANSKRPGRLCTAANRNGHK